MDKKLILSVIFASLIGGLISIFGYQAIYPEKQQQIVSPVEATPTFFTNNTNNAPVSVSVPEGLNFVYASEVASPGVVFIKTKARAHNASFFQNIYGQSFKIPPSLATGSGVIISKDGYVVTNNHVIENATSIEVVLTNNINYRATLVGADPSTDLALLKIEAEEDLPVVAFGNSDNLKIGEWVLAVGNPYRLTSTVTAGIISAKARSIDILKSNSHGSNYAIESFIQTDAVVNPGNSGGALVNLKGELIGVNTAIASPTGSYTGYSFAVPSVLVKKVVEDLKAYGKVQRGLLGINIVDASNPQIADLSNEREGVYIANVVEGGGADEGGLLKGDVIKAIDNKEVKSVPELQELVGQKRPGDVILVKVIRDEMFVEKQITLKNQRNDYGIIRSQTEMLLNAKVRDINEQEKYEADIDTGVKIIDTMNSIFADAGIPNNFIITHVDRTSIENLEDLRRIIEARGIGGNKSGKTVLLGKYEDGRRDYFYIKW